MLNDEVIIPSLTFKNAEEMLNTYKPTFFDTSEFYFKIVYSNDTQQSCFNKAVRLLFATSTTYAIVSYLF